MREVLCEHPDGELLASVASNGADLKFGGLPSPSQFPNRVSEEDACLVDDQIRADVERGWKLDVTELLELVPELAVAPNAPLIIVRKRHSSKTRVVSDMSTVVNGKMRGINGGIDNDGLGGARMAHVSDLGRGLWRLRRQHGADADVYLIVQDTSKAFRRIPVRWEDVPLLHTTWRGRHYFDTRLVFGCRSACHYQCLMSSAVADVVTQRLDDVGFSLAYVDDSATAVVGRDAASSTHCELRRLCDRLGTPLAPDKDFPPAQQAVWLGFGHDTVKMRHFLLEHKVQRALEEVDVILAAHTARRRLRVATLRSTHGYLQHLAEVLTVGRVYLRRLVASFANRHGEQRVRLSAGAVADLTWWRRILPDCSRLAAMRRAPTSADPHVWLDASTSGFGFHTAGVGYYGRWSQEWSAPDINFLELAAVLAACHRLGSMWAGSPVTFHSDNAAVVHVLSSGRARNPAMQHLLRDIFALAARYDFQVFSAHVPGRVNVIADSLSRDLKTSVPAGQFLVAYFRIDEPDAATEAATERWSTGPCPSLRRPPRRL